ncbi:MAG TPA: hypothetical protein VFJ58_28685 [Armatimonadota bacterium]|nr:hypothetical protein [Armatimonadota bacterium]
MRIVTGKERRSLAAEGRQIKLRIEELGFPRLWGSAPDDILQDTRAWQKKCANAGMSAASVYEKLGDAAHVSATQALLVIDETLLQLDPPGMIGG